MKSSDEISTKFVVRSNFTVRSGCSGTCHIGFCISSGWRSYKKTLHSFSLSFPSRATFFHSHSRNVYSYIGPQLASEENVMFRSTGLGNVNLEDKTFTA